MNWTKEIVKIILLLVILFNAWAGLIESRRKLKEAQERSAYRSILTIINLNLVEKSLTNKQIKPVITITNDLIVVVAGTNIFKFKVDSNTMQRIKP